jgi:hypothetical protein
MILQLRIIDNNNGFNAPYSMNFRMNNDASILNLKKNVNRLNVFITDKTFTDYNLKINDFIITNNELTLYECGIVNGDEIFIVYKNFT